MVKANDAAAILFLDHSKIEPRSAIQKPDMSGFRIPTVYTYPVCFSSSLMKLQCHPQPSLPVPKNQSL